MPPKKPAVTGRKVPAKGPVKPTTGGLGYFDLIKKGWNKATTDFAGSSASRRNPNETHRLNL